MGSVRVFLSVLGILLHFPVPEGYKKLLGCGLLQRISTQANTMDSSGRLIVHYEVLLLDM